MNRWRKVLCIKKPTIGYNGLLMGAAKSVTSLSIDKRCYESVREQGGKFGGNWTKERDSGHYIIILQPHKLKKW